ncbi:MAG: DegT/DnrJ/EryC1/StrS family aminotransferase [Taibaiella sp.]|nr:DegT/DnrJ/EryC1/StrS family aminotransferase [Taibaiella sp.]
MEKIQMVDLKGQYQRIKTEIDQAIQQVIDQAAFINGAAVQEFNTALSSYHQGAYVQSCGNGTDALQIALMALDLEPGSEIITPAFTYFATVEVVLLLGLKPVFVDVDPHTFNLDPALIEAAITPKTKAIVPVHLFGQCADMEPILAIAKKYDLKVIEDNAQSIGGSITYTDGSTQQAGLMGDISCLSFFPSKNLGCYGDGGAVVIKDEALYKRIKAIANHGQFQKYRHEMTGINSRLDTIQAAILSVKLQHLPQYNQARQAVAKAYDDGFKQNPNIHTPFKAPGTVHVYHQYTLTLAGHIDRDQLKTALADKGIPSMVYYPIPCHQQKALTSKHPQQQSFPVAEQLSRTVLSLPIHTEMQAGQIAYIVEQVNQLTQ